MSLDYYRVDVDRLNPAGPGNLTPFGTGASTPPIGARIGQEFNIFGLRSQFNF
jgi:phosphate-selective porin OprO/OprP